MTRLLDPLYLSRSELDFNAPWLALPDWERTLRARLASGRIPSSLEPAVRQYCVEGYTVFPKAVAAELCDRMWADMEQAWADRVPLLLNFAESTTEDLIENLSYAETRRRKFRYLRVHNVSEAALAVATLPLVGAFVRALFDEQAILLKAAAFLNGSEQRAHTDLAYMPIDRPLHSIATWVACEPVGLDNGPLFYIPGSHRLPPYDFGSGNLVIAGDADPQVYIHRWADRLEQLAKERGLAVRAFPAEKGDLMIWHPALVHGALKINDPALTRKSLVCHLGVLPEPRPAAALPLGPVHVRGDVAYCEWQHSGHVEQRYRLSGGLQA